MEGEKYFFHDINYYFLKNSDKEHRITKLQDQNVLSYLPGSGTYRQWIKENSLDFRKEADIVLFLTFYNKSN